MTDCSATATFTCSCGASCAVNLFEVHMAARQCTHIETRYLAIPPGWFVRVGYTLKDGEKYSAYIRCAECREQDAKASA